MKIFKMNKITGIFLVFVFIFYVFLTYISMNSEDTIETIENEPQNTLIKIFKKERLLELYANDQLIDKFNIGLGSSPIGDKTKEGDKKTPVGKYYICTRNDKSRFTLFLGISYPNTEDAKKALDDGLINQSIFEKIEKANKKEIQPPWKTPLGGEVGIHGGGSSSDWTWGCIALSDKDIKTLWQYAKLKTPVEIYE